MQRASRGISRASDRIIEDFSHLSLEDKEYVTHVMGRQIIEERRGELCQRALEARETLDRGLVKSGALKDLYEDLEDA
jgi:hypothetical protein